MKASSSLAIVAVAVLLAAAASEARPQAAAGKSTDAVEIGALSMRVIRYIHL